MERKDRGGKKKRMPADQTAKRLLRQDPNKHLLTLSKLYIGTIVPPKRIPSLIKVFEWAVRHTLFSEACRSAERNINALKEQLAEAEAEEKRGKPPFKPADLVRPKELSVKSLDGGIAIVRDDILEVIETLWEQEMWTVRLSSLKTSQIIEGTFPANFFRFVRVIELAD